MKLKLYATKDGRFILSYKNLKTARVFRRLTYKYPLIDQGENEEVEEIKFPDIDHLKHDINDRIYRLTLKHGDVISQYLQLIESRNNIEDFQKKNG